MEPQVCGIKEQMNLLCKFGHRNPSKTCLLASDKNQMLLAKVCAEGCTFKAVRVYYHLHGTWAAGQRCLGRILG